MLRIFLKSRHALVLPKLVARDAKQARCFLLIPADPNLTASLVTPNPAFTSHFFEMPKSSGAVAASKMSSASALISSGSASSNKSSILKFSFAPSYLQLRLFASVIQSFESQQLRIHDTVSGRLRHQHSIPAGTSATCLDWGCYGQSPRDKKSPQSKKRKRLDGNQQRAVVAYGTSNAEICLYSPSEDKVVATLRGGHEREIKDFKFLPQDNSEAWSIASDGKLVQWDLQTNKVTRSISLSDASIQTLCSPVRTSPQILCASYTPFAVHIESKDSSRLESYNAFKNPIHTLIRSESESKGAEETFIAVDQDRYINVYDVASKSIVRTLTAGGEVDHARIHRPVSDEDDMLAVITTDGAIELFEKPFSLPQSINGDLKARRKDLTRKANATVKLVSSDPVKKEVPVFSASFEGPNLIIVTTSGGIDPVFQKLRWQDEGNGRLLFRGAREIIRAKPATTLNTATMNGVKDMGQTYVNDARTVVVNGLAVPGSQNAPVEILSSDDEEEQSDDEDADPKADAVSDDESADDSNAEMDDADPDLEGTTAGDGEDTGEPSFGDMLAAQHPEVVSIMDSIPTDQNTLVKVPDAKQAILPSGMSLGTVLTQSLRTNDQSLLETCLHVTDEQVIQNTILRLDSSLAAELLTKLAERLADRPGRYGHLLTWVQSTMIAHGGAIASQARVASKLRTLYQVLNERSKILPSILLLKGKLDMMNAQQTFRAQAEAHRRGVLDAPAAIYVEGQEDNWSSDEEPDDEAPAVKQKTGESRVKKDLRDLIGAPESSDDEGMPLVNGQAESDDDNGSDLDTNGVNPRHVNGIVDDEAEVSGEDIDDNSGSEESGEEEDDEDEEDSEMDDFINDGEISMAEDEDDVDIDEEPERPTKKKSKHR